MAEIKKSFLFAALACAALPLSSQELWDPHLKLTAGMATNAESNYIAQNKVYGLALSGAYPITANDGVVFEGGYKFMPTTTTPYGMRIVDDKTDVYFASALYRRWMWRDGVYLQGGIRGTNAKTVRITTDIGVGANGSDIWERTKGDREIATGWVFGAGYRLTSLWSFELSASSVGFKNVAGNQKNGIFIEAALLIHR